MATLADFQQLSIGGSLNRNFAGTQGSPIVSPGVGAGSTIIVQNATADNGAGCLSCDEGACQVTPTNAVVFDNGSLKGASSSKIRMSFDIGTTAEHLTFMSNLGVNDVINFAGVTGIINPNIMLDATSHLNGIAAGAVVGRLNKTLAGGYVIASLILRFNNTIAANALLNDDIVKAFHFRARPEETPIITSEYGPFCDACFTSTNGDFSTHNYNLSTGVSFRDGVDILLGAGTSGIIELCLAGINLPNTLIGNITEQFI